MIGEAQRDDKTVGGVLAGALRRVGKYWREERERKRQKKKREKKRKVLFTE